jgi:hypothetical protein
LRQQQTIHRCGSMLLFNSALSLEAMNKTSLVFSLAEITSLCCMKVKSKAEVAYRHFRGP